MHRFHRLSLSLALACAAPPLFAQNTSSLVYPGPDGALVYAGYANEGQTGTGNRMIDFSRAGYMGGGVAIPWVPVEAALDPLPGDADDHARIQAAIDSVSALPLSPAGFRGAVLLRAGQYHVSQSLRIEADGVVVRGEGQHTGGTVITFTATVKDDLFEFFGSGGWSKISGTETAITDTLVPSGVNSFNVASAAGLSVGDRLIIHRTPNQAWIDLLDMGQYGWTPSGFRSETPRVVTAIAGNTVTVDAPLVHAIESQYGGGEVFRHHFNGALRQAGIENIRLESSFTSATDENHGWSAVMFRRVENGWARRVTARHFGYSCIDVRDESMFITVEDCAQLDPKSVVTGGRRYSFNLDDASFVLMQRCYARDGRHDFVTGSKTAGPNVFVDSLAENTNSDIGPHHRYAEGLLFDNVRGGPVNVQNRRSSGSGHGWAGSQTVFWNCHAGSIICDTPKAAMNFAIGCTGTQRQGQWQPAEPDGIWESRGVPVTPRSLYYTQLADRLGHGAVATATSPAQRAGTVWNGLSAWKGDTQAPGLPAFAPLGIDAGGDVATTAGSLELHAAIRYPLPDGFPMAVHGWSQVSGPAAAVFGNASSPSTGVTFPGPGVYELRFSASQEDDRDPENPVNYSDSDTITITVYETPSAHFATRSSLDGIVGQRMASAPAAGYYAGNPPSDTLVGGTGSAASETRYGQDLVYRYTLPTLAPGESVDSFTISFGITGFRDHAGDAPQLQVYLLGTADPTTPPDDSLFYRGIAIDPDHALVGTHYETLGTVTMTVDSGDALALLRGYYGGDHIPDQAEASFRFNLDKGDALDGSGLNRYFIDNDPATSGLALFSSSAEVPFAVWAAGFGLDPGRQGAADDPDGDGVTNIVEAWFGTHPGDSSAGISGLGLVGGLVVFRHPKSASPPSDITGRYEWSPNLVDWYAGDGADGPPGGANVLISTETADGTAHVTATPSAEMDRTFIRISMEMR